MRVNQHYNYIVNPPARPPAWWRLHEQQHHERESLLAEEDLQSCSAWSLCYCAAAMTWHYHGHYSIINMQVFTSILNARNVTFIMQRGCQQ